MLGAPAVRGVRRIRERLRAVAMVQLISQARHEIAGALSKELFAKLRNRATDEVRRILARAGISSRSTASSLSAVEAAQVLDAARDALERHLEGEVHHYSPMRWLWLLRRVPEHVFEGDYRTTAPYDRLLAEVLSSRSEAAGSMMIGESQLYYPLKGAFATHIGLFCAKVVMLSDIHRQARWAGKGSAFKWPKGQIIPFADPDHSLRKSVYRYDERAENEVDFGDSGTVTFDALKQADGHTVAFVPAVEPTEMTVPVGSSADTSGSVVARYFPRVVSAERFASLSGRATDLGAGWSEDTRLLTSTARRSLTHMAMHRTGLLSTVDVGYLAGARPFFAKWLGEATPEDQAGSNNLFARLDISVAEMLDRLACTPGSTWPLIGGSVIRHEDDVVCLDLVALTDRLLRIVRYPEVQGEIANERARDFEDAVQEALDRSSWSPAKCLREFRGRKLQGPEGEITDIDAVGSRGDTALLVSCKSMLRTERYEQGSFDLVRNRADAVVAAVDQWSAKCAKLKAVPRGNNYDISPYSRILGVVVTPSLFYVPEGEATSEVAPGLLAASSFTEFSRWLALEQ